MNDIKQFIDDVDSHVDGVIMLTATPATTALNAKAAKIRNNQHPTSSCKYQHLHHNNNKHSSQHHQPSKRDHNEDDTGRSYTKAAPLPTTELLSKTKQYIAAVGRYTPLLAELVHSVSEIDGENCKSCAVKLWNHLSLLAASSPKHSASVPPATARKSEKNPSSTTNEDPLPFTLRVSLQELAAELFLFGQKMLSSRRGPLSSHPNTAVSTVTLISRTARDLTFDNQFDAAERWFAKAISIVDNALSPRIASIGGGSHSNKKDSLLVAKIRLAVAELHINVCHSLKHRGLFQRLSEHLHVSHQQFHGRFKKQLIRFIFDTFTSVSVFDAAQQVHIRSILQLSQRIQEECLLNDGNDQTAEDQETAGRPLLSPRSAKIIQSVTLQQLALSFLVNGDINAAIQHATAAESCMSTPTIHIVLMRCALALEDTRKAYKELLSVVNHPDCNVDDVEGACQRFTKDLKSDAEQENQDVPPPAPLHKELCQALLIGLRRFRGRTGERRLQRAYIRRALSRVEDYEVLEEVVGILSLVGDGATASQNPADDANHKEYFFLAWRAACDLVRLATPAVNEQPQEEVTEYSDVVAAQEEGQVVNTSKSGETIENTTALRWASKLFACALLFLHFATNEEACCVLRGYSRCCARLKDYNTAIQAALDARDRDKHNVDTATILVRLAILVGDEPAALSHLELLLDAHPQLKVTDALIHIASKAADCKEFRIMAVALEQYIKRLESSTNNFNDPEVAAPTHAEGEDDRTAPTALLSMLYTLAVHHLPSSPQPTGRTQEGPHQSSMPVYDFLVQAGPKDSPAAKLLWTAELASKLLKKHQWTNRPSSLSAENLAVAAAASDPLEWAHLLWCVAKDMMLDNDATAASVKASAASICQVNEGEYTSEERLLALLALSVQLCGIVTSTTQEHQKDEEHEAQQQRIFKATRLAYNSQAAIVLRQHQIANFGLSGEQSVLLESLVANVMTAKRLFSATRHLNDTTTTSAPSDATTNTTTGEALVITSIRDCHRYVLLAEVSTLVKLKRCSDSEVATLLTPLLGATPATSVNPAELQNVLNLLLAQPIPPSPGSSDGNDQPDAGGLDGTVPPPQYSILSATYHRSTMLVLRHLTRHMATELKIAMDHLSKSTNTDHDRDTSPEDGSQTMSSAAAAEYAFHELLRLTTTWMHCSATRCEQWEAVDQFMKALRSSCPRQEHACNNNGCCILPCASQDTTPQQSGEEDRNNPTTTTGSTCTVCRHFRSILRSSDIRSIAAGEVAIEMWNSGAAVRSLSITSAASPNTKEQLPHNSDGSSMDFRKWFVACEYLTALLPSHNLARNALLERLAGIGMSHQ